MPWPDAIILGRHAMHRASRLGFLAVLCAGPAMAQTARPATIGSLNIAGTPILKMPSMSDITIKSAYMPAPDKTGDQPAYATFTNTGSADDLVGVSCADAQGTTISETNPKKRKNPGLSPMGTNELPILLSVPVPAHGDLVLKPGGIHFVLQDLSFVPRPGQTLGCTVNFRYYGQIDFDLPVVARDTVPKS